MPQAIPMLAYYAGGTLGATAGVFSTGWAMVASAVATAVMSDYQSTQAKERARLATREAARNRAFNVRSGIAPRKMVVGTMRVGGVVSYAALVGDEQQYVDQVVSLNHGPAEVLGVFMDDTFIPAASIVDHVVVDGAGGEKTLTYTASFGTASDTIRLPYTPNNEAAVTARHMPDETVLTVLDVSGKTVTLSAPYTGIVEVTYTTLEDPADKYSGTAATEQSMEYAVVFETPGDTITLPLLPNDPAKVAAVRSSGATGESSDAVPVTVASVVGHVVTLAEAQTGRVEIHYTSNENPIVPLRVQWTAGTDTQGPTSWGGVDTPKWTADHLQLGVLYLRTLMLTDANAFQQGLASPSALLKGMQPLYDPRTDADVTGTANPALWAAWYATLPRSDGGCGWPDDLMDWDSVATAANICDELISVRQMDGSGYEDIKRYECHTVLTLGDTAPDDNLRTLVSAMAGEWAFTGGKFRLVAGAHRTATLTITDDDVDGESPIVFAPLNSPEDEPPNTITARIYSAAANWMETAPREVQNSAYVTADGGEIHDELELPATTDERQANYLMGVYLERQRPALGGQVTLLGVGADVALMDTVQFNLTGYEDLVGRTFEVRRRTNAWTGKYPIELREVKASTWTLDPDRFTAVGGGDTGGDPDLWDVDPVVITDVVNAAQMQADGSTLARAMVQWAALTQPYVVPRGFVEVRYKAAGTGDWIYATPVPATHVGTFLAPLAVGTVLWIEARARNAVGAISAWSSTPPFEVTGSNDLPPDPTGYGWEIKPAQARVYWDPVPDSTLEMELRLGATWAAGALMWRGKSTDYKIARPPNGTYRVWMAWRRQIGPSDDAYSAAPVFVDVVVDDSIDGGLGGLLVLTTDGTHFLFADGTTHVSASPPINYTARGVGLPGTATWAARAFDAFSGGADIGPVTLAINGNGAVLTAAAFAAAGTLGSVRRVQVTATLGGQSDTRTAYRLDPTVTASVLWLSDEYLVVPGDAAGEHPDLSGAVSYAAVYQGNGTSAVTELTNVHTWSITPDAGITCTINGVAGPVVNPASVELRVTAMTIRRGVVAVHAAPASGPTLTAYLHIDISAADGSGWHAYWEPPSLTLPVDAQGNVSSFDGARSDFAIVNAVNQLDDTERWDKSITARNVTAQLTDARVQILSWLPLGQVTMGSTIPATLHASWTRADWPIYTPQGNWVQKGYSNSAPWAVIRRATAYDAAPWTDIAVPSGWWELGDASRDTIILVEVTGSSARYLRSTDDGLTWTEEALPAGAQRTSCINTGAEWLISSHGSTVGYRSITGVAGTWTAVTLPGTACQLAGGAGVVLATTGMGVQYYSINGGVSWVAMPDGYTGAAAFRGRLYTVLATDPTKMLVWDGGRWTKQALASSAAGFSGLLVVRDVLYLIAGGNIQYTTDGLTWRAGGSGMSTYGAWVRSGSRALQCDYIPTTDVAPSASAYAKWTMLQSTSDTEASVTMLATKPGEEPIRRTLMVYKGLATRVTYVASADPADCPVPATSDGKVTSFANAVITGHIKADSQDVTGLYTITWQTTYLTPASGSGAVATITGMSDTQPVGYIDWQGVRPGYDVVTGRTMVRKVFGDVPSGPNLRRLFTLFGQSATYIALRFAADGWWYTKTGSGGSWIAQDRWVIGADPAGFWLYMLPPPEGAFTGGTTGSWQQLTVNRDFEFSDASPGTHTRTVRVGINSAATDVGAGWGGGEMTLIVP